MLNSTKDKPKSKFINKIKSHRRKVREDKQTRKIFHIQNIFSNKRVPIKIKLISICILFAIIPVLVVNIISYSISKGALSQTSQKLAIELVKQVSSNVDSFLETINTSVTQGAVVNIVQNDLLADYISYDSLKKLYASKEIQQKLLYLGTMDKNISNAALILNDSEIIGQIPQVANEDLLSTKDIKVENQSMWVKGLGSATDKLFFIKKVSSQNINCTLVIDVNMERIDQILNEIILLKDSGIYIADENGKLIFTKDSLKEVVEDNILSSIDKEIEFGTARTDKKLVTYSKLSNKWNVIAEIPEKSLTTQLDASVFFIWVLILIVGLLAVIVGTIFAKGFSTPIIKLMKLMKQAEDGDLTVMIDEKGNDEITDLCGSFNHMISNIRKLLNDTQSVIVSTLDDSIVLRSSTKQSAETFEQLAVSIEEIAQGTTHQAEDTQQSAASMSFLSENIQEVIHKTNTIFERNQGAKDMIQIATDSMKLLSNTMESSIEISSQIQTSILGLSKLTHNIEDIMKLVDGISEQTNLLALNASIEAARAGEAGKGFAVVANEVRNLAEQSKSSTVNVREALNTIELKTQYTVKLVNKSNNIFSSQEEAVNKVHQIFFDIIDSLKTMGFDLEQVNDKVQSMKSLRDEMVEKIDNIAAVTQESAASTEEINALSDEQKNTVEKLYDLSNRLTDSMSNLNHSIKSFKVV
ncbi:methyl-accepting chemotaxis protein [Mobilisporobacter senegalensis]|uniref:Methyl-accepting chemotaxis protein n=2 Tax=Mobilisporobacter senegalensis TaxID=1329262 RepID=A0A3N1X9I2_9FIRM|nr:methyl-accepting chemotaxis protein [Mobilisporobacter senegalensis]